MYLIYCEASFTIIDYNNFKEMLRHSLRIKVKSFNEQYNRVIFYMSFLKAFCEVCYTMITYVKANLDYQTNGKQPFHDISKKK